MGAKFCKVDIAEGTLSGMSIGVVTTRRAPWIRNGGGGGGSHLHPHTRQVLPRLAAVQGRQLRQKHPSSLKGAPNT